MRPAMGVLWGVLAACSSGLEPVTDSDTAAGTSGDTSVPATNTDTDTLGSQDPVDSSMVFAPGAP